jgi:hypothetical protein
MDDTLMALYPPIDTLWSRVSASIPRKTPFKTPLKTPVSASKSPVSQGGGYYTLTRLENPPFLKGTFCAKSLENGAIACKNGYS